MRDDVLERWAAGLEDVLGVPPAPAPLFLEAFTHASYANEQPPPRPADNQRLEFLGDAVISLAVAHELWRRFPHWSEGDLAWARIHLVNTEALAARGRALGLGGWLRLGKGEQKSGGRDRDAMMCDVFEAVVGALFVAYGWEKAASFVLEQLEPSLAEVAAKGSRALDAKTRLQERLHREASDVPVYKVVETRGPAHRPTFVVEVFWRGAVIGSGRGGTKRAAEQAAAEDALGRLPGFEPDGPPS